MRDGLAAWHARCDVVVVEGSGGLLSPLGASECVADLAAEFGYPLVIVAGNALGVINQALQTVHVARTYRGGIPIAGVVLNTPRPPSGEDPSRATNRSELEARLTVPLLSEVSYEADRFDREVDWEKLAKK
jgi:dethiobiotin synthetase